MYKEKKVSRVFVSTGNKSRVDQLLDDPSSLVFIELRQVCHQVPRCRLSAIDLLILTHTCHFLPSPSSGEMQRLPLNPYLRFNLLPSRPEILLRLNGSSLPFVLENHSGNTHSVAQNDSNTLHSIQRPK